MTRTTYLDAFATWFGARMNGGEGPPTREWYANDYLFDQAIRRHTERQAKSAKLSERFAAAVALANLPDEAEIDEFCALLRPHIDRYDEITIAKSSLLCRLLYDGETLRTTPCPTHKGRWSGCHPEPCEHGCDYVGWLPNPVATP